MRHSNNAAFCFNDLEMHRVSSERSTENRETALKLQLDGAYPCIETCYRRSGTA